MKKIKVSEKLYIGEESKVFIVAEMSANHLQNFDNAVKIIKEAKKAGADAIKLQTYTPDTMTLNIDNEYFRIKQGTIWDNETFYDLYKKAYTPWDWHPKLKEIAEEEGLIFFSTPFDKTAVDFLEDLDVPIYKIASFEITDIPLIEYIAKKGKPIILSTGIATLTDIELALNTIRGQGNNQIVLLKCTSSYPAPVEDANLMTIPHMAQTFDCITGLSDHTRGISVPITSVAYGARLIEKHFTLDRSLGGPDASFSLEPDEFKHMVTAVREAEKAMGKISYTLTERQKRSREFARSLFVVEDVKKGETLTEENVRSIRPGFGLHPKHYREIIGKRAAKDIKKGTPLSWDMIEF